MKNILLLITISLVFSWQSSFAKDLNTNNEPAEAYIFAYSTDLNRGHNGLHFAWSINGEDWHSIGPCHSYVRCDYGRWGSEKRMLDPYLFLGESGVWHCIWSLNEKDDAFAHASTKNLVYWGRQSYPRVEIGKNCLKPEVTFDKASKLYTITWISDNGESTAYSCTTKDFKEYTEAKEIDINNYKNSRKEVTISGKKEKGTMHKVAWSVVNELIKAQQLAVFKGIQNNEKTIEDPVRFASLQPLEMNVSVEASKNKKISNMLVGAFFEDLNYAADGGLYAELVQNRDFEYTLSDKEYRDKSWNSTTSWSLNDKKAIFTIDSVLPIHSNNKHYAVLNISEIGAGLINEGFDGIAIKAGEKYNFSVFARALEGKNGKITIRLKDKNGKVYAESATKSISNTWKQYDAILTVKETVSEALLEVIPQTEGTVALDMISLFPQKTFKNRKNGLRADLAQLIADMKPRFVRFPGGCLAHGDGLGNIYHWKNTVGSLESRKPQRNIWGYHQTVGLGYFEYFQFCADIGAEPMPIVAAGVPCQNSATGGSGQQGGIPMCEMDDYVQDVLDLIEWANGDARTTKWGKIRAQAGHPKPFGLKYIGVGNEDLITDIFEERFTLIFNAVKEKHPEITVIGTSGPASEGTDYVEGWDIASKLGVPMIDEHYYQTPGWFINNQDYYDRYDRSKAKVYLGEYAAHLPERPNNVETALAEALYLTSLERNGDIVSMASYAPLLAKEGHTQWNPDLIYFNNTEVKPTVGYHIQKLYGLNSGDEYFASNTTLSNNDEAVKKRIAVSVVKDSETNSLIIKLVNLLPVAVKTSVDLKDFNIKERTAIKTVLTSRPDDKGAKPKESTHTIGNAITDELPAYSFTVFRIQVN